MKLTRITVFLLLIFGYLYFSYVRFYNFIDRANLKSPYITNTFTLDTIKGVGTVKYVALGDSLTAGVGSIDVIETFSYQYALKLLETNKKVSVVNLGQSGATTTDVINSQLPRAISENPNHITLLIGINDLHNRVSTKDFEKNYNFIVNELLNKTKANIVVINLPYLGSDKLIYSPFNLVLDYRTKEFNKIIFASSNNSRIKFVDLYTTTSDISKNNKDFYSSDLFHPSGIGYMLWGKIINEN